MTKNMVQFFHLVPGGRGGVRRIRKLFACPRMISTVVVARYFFGVRTWELGSSLRSR